MTFEASSRIQDPVYGCTLMISQLQHQIMQTQYEIAKIQAEIAFFTAQQQLMNHQRNANQAEWTHSIEQQHGFHLEDQHQNSTDFNFHPPL
ncbi:hypothetical protein U1Q18_024727 [Sarracenia purpurea var. burkii]